ncbi:MAG TPA: 3-oxoacyl-ACP synthase [Polyangia bacterium]|jgi:3-oxoacyl-[acyl-carrier-protein] synthase-3|nr:3-oxoacyl-ACP synthase [Polyangia bacterium]
MASNDVGIVAYGLYLPETFMTAADVARASGGHWTEAAVREKLGFDRKTIPGPDDGTQAMGVRAAVDCLRRFRYDPEKIDVVLCVGEEWKEYPLTTSGIYIQEQIGARRAWALDVQQRCCSLISAMKLARDLIVADEEVDSVMIVGGYRNGDFVDYANPRMSMMYNLAAGACAVILERDAGANLVVGTRIMSDGSMARDVGCRIGGTVEPITHGNLDAAYRSLDLMDAEHMKARLNQVSMPNWLACIDGALGRAKLSRKDIGYLAVLHFKPSMHRALLDELGLGDAHTTYLRDYGHLGQIDQVLSLHLGLEAGKVGDGTVVCMIAAGIGYAWAANVIRWGQGR